jgi:hypothetical protein
VDGLKCDKWRFEVEDLSSFGTFVNGSRVPTKGFRVFFSLSLSLSHTHTHTRSLSLSLSLSRAHTHTHTHTHVQSRKPHIHER